MRQTGPQLDVITFSALVSAREKGQRWQRALDFLAEMRQTGLQLDVISFNALISACEKQKLRGPDLDAGGATGQPVLA